MDPTPGVEHRIRDHESAEESHRSGGHPSQHEHRLGCHQQTCGDRTESSTHFRSSQKEGPEQVDQHRSLIRSLSYLL